LTLIGTKNCEKINVLKSVNNFFDDKKWANLGVSLLIILKGLQNQGKVSLWLCSCFFPAKNITAPFF